MDVGEQPRKKCVWVDLDTEVDQLWAEAVVRWRLGEDLYLTGDLEAAAVESQEAHREEVEQAGPIREFLGKRVPADWNKWGLDQRRAFWAGGIVDDVELVERDRVCALEIWCELYGRSATDLRRPDAHAINQALSCVRGWAKNKTAIRFGGPYGVQKGWRKKL